MLVAFINVMKHFIMIYNRDNDTVRYACNNDDEKAKNSEEYR